MIVDEEAEVNRANVDGVAIGLALVSRCQELPERILLRQKEKKKNHRFCNLQKRPP
jgi:hypothetical protein